MSSPASPDTASRRALLEAAYREACLAELRALKPGNVHIHGAGHGMSLGDFELSAEVTAAPLTVPGRPVGMRLLEAARATRDAVGCNTNLGILLLAAPLLAAAETASAGGLRPALVALLAGLTLEDAVNAYAAIRIAQPAGLGEAAEQDVARPPTMGLGEAMVLAAARDRIARQYATGYADIFALGLARLSQARGAGASPEGAAAYVYLSFLAGFPDSHIQRKHGAARAEAVRVEAANLLARLPPSAAALEGEAGALLAFDRSLKDRGLNPGSSADLTVASLLAAAIADILQPGRGKNHCESQQR